MALPPTIPTSFVPRQPVATAGTKKHSGVNPFLALSYFILGIAIFGCFAVFGFQFYLTGIAKAKAQQVVTAQQNIDQATVSEFIRLRDRLSGAKEILNRQVALSQFFDTLENLTLQGVRFKSLQLSINEDRSATVAMSGTARSFNTLAAQSAQLATEKRIKRAIFSGINVNPKDQTVSFTLNADLDPTLVERSPDAAPAATQPAPAQTTTPPATSPAPAQATAPAATTTP